MQKTISCKTMLLLAGLLSFSLSSTAQAADTVVVIPMGSAKPLQNVVTVAKGNSKFTNPVAAVNSITDASATNPYLVLIAPGTYTLTTTLVMKPYVDISGSGENITSLTGAISSANLDETAAIVKGANHTTLSNLSISNTGGSDNSFGIYITGLDNSARLHQVNVTATGGVALSTGVLNDSSSPIMTQMSIITSGGTGCYGVYNKSFSSSPTMTEVTIAASGGTNNFAIYNMGNDIKVRRSTLAGTTAGIISPMSEVIISQSTIIGDGFNNLATCVACDNGAGKALIANCTVAP